MKKAGQFVHLRVHSAYSLAYGAVKIDKLLELCSANCLPAIAITDVNNLFGALEFSLKCAKAGIKPIIGCQLNIQAKEKFRIKSHVGEHLLLFAKNTFGWGSVSAMVTEANLHSSSDDFIEISAESFKNLVRGDSIIALTGNVNSTLGRLISTGELVLAEDHLKDLLNIFRDNLYIEICRHGEEKEQKIESILIDLAMQYEIPLVATNNVCYPDRSFFEAHDIFTCIAQSTTIFDSNRKLSSPEYYFKSPEEMEGLFKDLPEAIENTVIISQRCSFMLRERKVMLPHAKIPSDQTEKEYLRTLSYQGLKKQISKLDQSLHCDYFDRLEYELNLIDKMGFNGYFLIVADYVQWAKSNGIPVGPGRGSGAGSIVAWSLTITDIDPIRFKLFFERFLNPDRVSMPDFDIDFCQERRDEVIAYMQMRYGYESIAQIITFGKLQARAVIKDVGRVLAMPYGLVDKISKMVPFVPTNPVTLQQAIDGNNGISEMMEQDVQVQKLINIALKLEGLYRHASVHAAGIVISDGRVQDFSPLYKDPRAIMPATQFSMKYIEAAGLVKFDFLGLKTLTVIQKTLNLIKKRGISLCVTDILLDDFKTFELLRSVNCVGVFQIESAGMRDVLKKLQPDKIEDLIALVALYRPGPMDDIPKYIACKHGHEKIYYEDEKLIPILQETYGVMVYQEQVMQIAQTIGGYTMGQADILRRAMGKKNREEMFAQKKKFISGAVANSISQDVAERLFEQMNKFAGYGFNKSHSTPYGLLTYQTAYLKANYCTEFFCAIMTCDLEHTDKLGVYVKDAKFNNVIILPPNINTSHYDFIVNDKSEIIYSLAALKGSGKNIVEHIVEEREKNGNYQSVFDFVSRLSENKILNKRVMESLIKSGSFDCFEKNRNKLLQNLDLLLGSSRGDEQPSLFEYQAPFLKEAQEWGSIEKAGAELEAFGFYFASHPLDQYCDVFKKHNIVQIIEANQYQKSHIVVSVMSVKYKNSKNGSKFCILEVSDSTGVIEVTVFSEVLEKSKEFIEVGSTLSIIVGFYKSENFERFTVYSIEKFDVNNISSFTPVHYEESKSSIFENNKEITVCTPSNEIAFGIYDNAIIVVKIQDDSCLVKVKELISLLTHGNTGIELLFPIEGEKLALHEKYKVNFRTILDFESIVGKDNVILQKAHQ